MHTIPSAHVVQGLPSSHTIHSNNHNTTRQKQWSASLTGLHFLVIPYVLTLQFPSPGTCKHKGDTTVCAASRASHQNCSGDLLLLVILLHSIRQLSTLVAIHILHTSLTTRYCHLHHRRRYLSPSLPLVASSLFVAVRSLQLLLAACPHVGHGPQSTMEAPKEGLRQGEV